MINSKYIELIHQEIDNEISPENKGKLRAYMATNKEAETFYKELIHCVKLLEQVPEVEPPQDQSKRIMNSIHFNLYPNQVEKYNPKRLIDWFLKPTPKPAYAFALGLIIGLIAYALVFMLIFREQPIDFADVYGTISTIDNHRFENMSMLPIDIPDVKGNINLSRYKNAIIFEINIQPLQNLTLKMEFDQNNFNFSSYHPLSPAQTEFENRGHMIKLSGSNDIKCALLFEKIQNKTSPINFSIETKGKTIYYHNFLIKK